MHWLKYLRSNTVLCSIFSDQSSLGHNKYPLDSFGDVHPKLLQRWCTPSFSAMRGLLPSPAESKQKNRFGFKKVLTQHGQFLPNHWCSHDPQMITKLGIWFQTALQVPANRTHYCYFQSTTIMYRWDMTCW